MHENFEDSPWFHVHFTVPNQTTKRRLVNFDGERRRVNNLIQERHTFLATKNRSRISRPKNACKQVRQQRKTDFDSEKLNKRSLKLDKLPGKSNSVKTTPNNATVIEHTLFIDSTERQQIILPPLRGNKYLTSKSGCQEQQAGKCNKTGKLPFKDQKSEIKAPEKSNHGKTISIARCYDLGEWKPLNSVCQKPPRTLVSILKQNPFQAQVGPQGHRTKNLVTNSDSSGNESENEASKVNKRVHFAKDTKFHSGKGRRGSRKTLENNEDLVNMENLSDDIFELSFQEFIERKRLERSVPASNTGKDSKLLCFLKEDTTSITFRNPVKPKNSRSSGNKQTTYDSNIEKSLFPAIVN